MSIKNKIYCEKAHHVLIYRKIFKIHQVKKARWRQVYIVCHLYGIKEKAKHVCLSASVCAENSGRIGEGPAAVTGLGRGGREEPLEAGGVEYRGVREISHCIPFYAFWCLKHVNIVLFKKLNKTHCNRTEILNRDINGFIILYSRIFTN